MRLVAATLLLLSSGLASGAEVHWITLGTAGGPPMHASQSQIAVAAGIKHVVLTHFVPGFEEVEDPRVFTRGIAPAFDGPVSVAHDLDRF